jgi:hypothetical protein
LFPSLAHRCIPYDAAPGHKNVPSHADFVKHYWSDSEIFAPVNKCSQRRLKKFDMCISRQGAASSVALGQGPRNFVIKPISAEGAIRCSRLAVSRRGMRVFAHESAATQRRGYNKNLGNKPKLVPPSEKGSCFVVNLLKWKRTTREVAHARPFLSIALDSAANRRLGSIFIIGSG